MPRKFNPEGRPAPQFYSQAAEVAAGERLVFISGQVGVGPDGQMAEGTGEQARLAIDNLKAVLAAADMTLDDVVKYTFYLTDPSEVGGFMQAAAALVTQPPAATTMLFVAGMPDPRIKVEIEAVAAKAG